MGVPKFFRYISERYPCLSELARENCIPEFDNLYLDMNGIIHNCSHPDDSNIHFHIEEEQIFKDICNYLDKLFYLIKPQKLFFMAVDGVAPRAKMNQQRGRRFRSAKEAENLENSHNERGGTKRLHERFDSNCITPGTEFMERLQEALREFIKKKVTFDPLWKNIKIILSGHNVPGEGEHKIMDYIRYLKSKKDFNPNTRHCLYGLDADLIILGLCTHELHFVILREEVKFGRKKTPSVEQTRFFLLHLGLMREYLELEFDQLRKKDPTFDVAKIIDDWVLMGFLVGNDFVPHLPCLHINLNALPLLYQTYMNVYPKLGGNINEKGKLNLERLEIYFRALSDVEYIIFQEQLADLQFFNAKISKNGIQVAFDVDIEEIKNTTGNIDLNDLIQDSSELFDPNDDEEDILVGEAKQKLEEFHSFKKNYYHEKFEMEYNKDTQQNVASCYIVALQWILDYYYRGVQSWDWYYPYHYSPFISDLHSFRDMTINFNKGKPFLPFQQLLAVLPAASKNLLPEAYRDLMTSPSSELVYYYPAEFKSDLNGKKNEWEAVVLIPFIDEKLLLSAMAKCEHKLMPGEKRRNAHGDVLMYKFNSDQENWVTGERLSICMETSIKITELAIDTKETVCVELPNASRHVFFPGFPTMKHLKFNFELKMGRVKVFDYPSRSLNMILQPEIRPLNSSFDSVIERYLYKTVYVGWPHLIKGKVVEVLACTKALNSDGMRDHDESILIYAIKSFDEHLKYRMGIELEDMSVLVKVHPCNGHNYDFDKGGKVVTNDAWSNHYLYYPAQCVVPELTVYRNYKKHFENIEDFFPIGSTVFYIGHPHYGSAGIVLNATMMNESSRIHVELYVDEEPNLTSAKLVESACENSYLTAMEACNATNVSIKVLGRLTGSLMVIPGARRPKPPENLAKYNIGLQFKYPKQLETRIGYARRIKGQWFYSVKALNIVQNYCDNFPDVIYYMSRTPDRGEFCFEEDIYPNNIGDKYLERINNWVKSQEHMKSDSINFSSTVLEKETIQELLNLTDKIKHPLVTNHVKLFIKPELLVKPNFTPAETYMSGMPLLLFDRVVVIRTTYTVPIGTRGTIVGIYPSTDPNPVRLECFNMIETFYEVLFDKRIPSCNNMYDIAEERVYRLPENSLLHVSDEDRSANFPPSMKYGNQLRRNQVKQEMPSCSNLKISSDNHFWAPTLASVTSAKSNFNNNGASTSSGTGATPRGRGSNNNGNQQQYQMNFTQNRSNNQSKHFNSNSNAFQRNMNSRNNQHRSRDNASGPSSSGNSNYPRITILKKPPQTVELQQNTSPSMLTPFVPHPSQPLPLQHLPMGFGSTSRIQGGLQMPLLQRSQLVQPPTGTANASVSNSAQQQTLVLRDMLGLNPPESTPEHKQLPHPPIFWQRQAQSSLVSDAAVSFNSTPPRTTNLMWGDLSLRMDSLTVSSHVGSARATTSQLLLKTGTSSSASSAAATSLAGAAAAAPSPTSFAGAAAAAPPPTSFTGAAAAAPPPTSFTGAAAAAPPPTAFAGAAAAAPPPTAFAGAAAAAPTPTSFVGAAAAAAPPPTSSASATAAATTVPADSGIKKEMPPRKKRVPKIGARFDFA